MKIAIRKEPNGSLYIDKEIYSRTHEVRDEELAQPPYNYKIVEIDDKYADCVASDFNDDLSFSIDKYKSRKETEAKIDYETKIVSLIRKKYNINQELAILRQRDTKPTEFVEYSKYVEKCKAEVKSELKEKR